MLDGMWSAVKSDVETELISSSHMSALLLQQLLQQADEVHLRMNVSVAELENKLVPFSFFYDPFVSFSDLLLT